MIIRIGIENNYEGRSLAWDLEHPGCFVYGANEDQALSAIPDAYMDYVNWIAIREETADGMQAINAALDPITEISLEETWEVFAIDDQYEPARQGYEVNAWFQHDWKPLTPADVTDATRILMWSRDDLLDTVANLSPEQASREFTGERWSIDGILRHVAGAEWWYLDRLGLAFPRENLAKDTRRRLAQVREAFYQALAGLADIQQVVGVDGEFWSPRKLVRRAAWHERDHVEHIRKLINRLGIG